MTLDENNFLLRGINYLNSKIQNVLDKAINFLDNIVNKIGYNGYLLFGFLSSTLMFFSTLSLHFIPQVDWSICIIVRGVSTYFFSSITSIIYKKDTGFKGNSFKYVSIRNIIMGLHFLFFQYVLVVLPINVVWVILNMCPLFVFIVNYFMFSATVTFKQIILLLISLFGVCLITIPQIYIYLVKLIYYSNDQDNGQESLIDKEFSNNNFVAIAFIISQIFWAYAVSVIKKADQITSLVVTLHFGLILIFYGSVMLFQRSNIITFPSLYDIFKVFIFYGIGSYIPSLLFIHGTMIAKCQGRYTLTNYVTVLYSYLFNIFYQNKNPNIIEFVGLTMAFSGLYKMLVK